MSKKVATKKVEKDDSKRNKYYYEMSRVQFRNLTIERLEKLGNYKKEYDDLIYIYADLLYQYHQTMESYKDEGFPAEVPTERGGFKKHPKAETLALLRKDIITYSDRLGLSPKAIETLSRQPEDDDPLSSAMEALGKSLK